MLVKSFLPDLEQRDQKHDTKANVRLSSSKQAQPNQALEVGVILHLTNS